MPRKTKERRAFDELLEAEPEMGIPELPPGERLPAIRSGRGRIRDELRPGTPTRIEESPAIEPPIAAHEAGKRSGRHDAVSHAAEESEKSVAHSGESRYQERKADSRSAEVAEDVREEDQQQPGRQVEAALNALFAGLPDDPRACLDAVVSLQRIFRREAARLLQPHVNQLLKSPPDTFVEKQQLASIINNDLRELGLAARDESITQPCSVVALQGGTGKTSWLKLQTRKSPQQKSRPTTELGEIALVEAIRDEAFGRGKGQ